MTTITKETYGTTKKGETVHRYALKNAMGMEVHILTYGGIIAHLAVPDRDGTLQNVVLNLDSLAGYEAGHPYFGALIGRYGNRIANAQFTLEGTTYTLAANNGPNNLHGGEEGFDKKVWEVVETSSGEQATLGLRYLSPDMEEGFPGNLDVRVTYTLTAKNTLEVAYTATTDKSTVVNLTQHAYFNLTGDFTKSVMGHQLQLRADHVVPVNPNLIPTGRLMEVAGTPFDFRTQKAIGRDIGADHGQLRVAGGYDHCWALDNPEKQLRSIAVLTEPVTGRVMEVATTEPGVQLYTGNFLDGTLPIPGGGHYGQRSGLCLETQHYPDSPNQPQFPSVVLRPGERYFSKTVFGFATQ
ncbi:aldose epimerase family protein [Maribacter sp. 2307ULW6-5]|uniref:aldose epimerase family protein n=1 Tax=Maribacter sp. 2307ULW6-5 TaxID=3386275 RepID=UPI0039BD63AE